MTRLAALAIALAATLAACAGPPQSAIERRCAAQANDDPVVHGLIIKGLGSPFFQENSQGELRAARRHAEEECLRRQGVLAKPRGGVEGTHSTNDTLFDW
jgi:ABC-type sugar transport system substrate-binding protein